MQWRAPWCCPVAVSDEGVRAGRDIAPGELVLREEALATASAPRGDDTELLARLEGAVKRRCGDRSGAAAEALQQLPRRGAGSLLELLERHAMTRGEASELPPEDEVPQGPKQVALGAGALFVQDLDDVAEDDEGEAQAAAQGECGLWVQGALLAHSCTPNCSSVIRAGGLLEVRACGAVRSGEQLTLSRVPLLLPRGQRRRRLERKGIDCGCARCEDPSADDAEGLSALRCPRRWQPLALGSVVTDVGGREEQWRSEPPPPLREPGPAAGPLVVHSDPLLRIVPGFLSEEEAAHLIAITDGRWRSAALPGRRTSASVLLRHGETAVVAAIERRAAELCGVPAACVERLGCVRYEAGEYFSLHHDGTFRPQTIFVYLNDVERGGRTLFPRIGVACRPRKGWAVHWNNRSAVSGGGDWADARMAHEGEAVGEGCVKYGVNIFINALPVQELARDRPAAAHAIRAAGLVPDDWAPTADTELTQLLLHALAGACEGTLRDRGGGLWRCDACGECRSEHDALRPADGAAPDPLEAAGQWTLRYGRRRAGTLPVLCRAARFCARTCSRRPAGLRAAKRAIAVMQGSPAARPAAAELAELYLLAAALSSRQEQLALLRRAMALRRAALGAGADSVEMLQAEWAAPLRRAHADIAAAEGVRVGQLPRGVTSGVVFSEEWLSATAPLCHEGMGCENMGTMLYAVVRFAKPARCLEVGAGYTTAFLLQALADNADELAAAPLSTWHQGPPQSGGGGVLVCVDNCSHPHTTAHRAVTVAQRLGLAGRLRLYSADAADYVAVSRERGTRFDLVWLDGVLGFDRSRPMEQRTEAVVDAVWPLLNPGGTLLVHSTLTNRATRGWVESLREKGAERLSLLEPHKGRQNSFTALRKRPEGFSEPLLTDLP
eukprot:TRINITY_DN12024_c0_g1_i1.p1 TRINITY_DN12024_c0_g1~~TRINITY_DN12024_c0_g1_i1.p1  ORF type:complete len:895 (+),score=274.09 TRINITY_DN12024_c0_g1_i1:66-2750(+)